MLFRPNTEFAITSTLYGTSDIGQFYSCIDNIAITDLSSAAAQAAKPPPGTTAPGPARPPPCVARAAPGATHVVVEVPEDMFCEFLTCFANLEPFTLASVVTDTDPAGERSTLVTLEPSLSRGPSSASSAVPDPVCAAADPVPHGGDLVALADVTVEADCGEGPGGPTAYEAASPDCAPHKPLSVHVPDPAQPECCLPSPQASVLEPALAARRRVSLLAPAAGLGGGTADSARAAEEDETEEEWGPQSGARPVNPLSPRSLPSGAV